MLSEGRNPQLKKLSAKRLRRMQPAGGDADERIDARAQVVRTIILAAIGLLSVGVAIWGVWVSADVSHYVRDPGVAGVGHNLNTAVFLLSWLVLFLPFLLLGVAMLWSAFVEEDRSWLVPLRMFSFLVGLKVFRGWRRTDSRRGGREQFPEPREQNLLESPPDETRGEE